MKNNNSTKKLNGSFIDLIRSACLFLFALLQCSTQQDIAGGTGAGNPGGPTRLSMIANSTSLINLSKGLIQDDIEFTIRDSSNAEFTIDSVIISASKIRFLLKNEQDVQNIITGSGTTLIPFEGALLLDKAFGFNAITGAVEPAFDSFFLPEADYIGIVFELESDSSNITAIEFSGTFYYKEILHPFNIKLNAGDPIHCMFNEQHFTVTHSDTTLLVAYLEASGWLNGVNIKGAIDSGLLQFDTTGKLVIDFRDIRGPVRALAAMIRVNINASTSLQQRVTQRIKITL